jgi:hypothetical protein
LNLKRSNNLKINFSETSWRPRREENAQQPERRDRKEEHIQSDGNYKLNFYLKRFSNLFYKI